MVTASVSRMGFLITWVMWGIYKGHCLGIWAFQTMSPPHLLECVCHGYRFWGHVPEESQSVDNLQVGDLSFLIYLARIRYTLYFCRQTPVALNLSISLRVNRLLWGSRTYPIYIRLFAHRM